MKGKSFLGVALESHREGGRLQTLGRGSTAVLLGLDWHRPGVTVREQIEGPGLRQVACFLGSRDEELREVLGPMQSNWGGRRAKEGEGAAGLPPGWVGGARGGMLSPFTFLS